MTGLEVVGIALGSIPIVLHFIDVYKNSIRRVGTTIRKRKHVEKLARALLLQQQILEETVKSVVLACGGEDVSALEDDPLRYFSNEDVRERVENYLGVKNCVAFAGLLTGNNDVVRKVAKNISGLVPAHQEATDDLVAIIRANQRKTDLLLDLAPRVKLLIGITDIKATIREIDDGTAALDRFSRLIMSNRQLIQSDPSRKAAKLAKAFRHVHALAGNLYRALTDGFQEECHGSHETRLYLEDRVDTATDILKRIGGADSSTPVLTFDLVFATGMYTKEGIFYETVVQIFDEDEQPSAPDFTLSTETLSPSETDMPKGFTYLHPKVSSPAKPAITTVDSICATIREAHGSTDRITFGLVGNQPIGTISDYTFPSHQAQTESTTAVSLREILQVKEAQLPWKYRMLLALRLASNMLQLLQTRWLEHTWSKEVVFFLGHQPPGQSVQISLNRPFVRTQIGDTETEPRSVEPKVALLELGILLLEIWHKMTLEARFGLEVTPTSYYDRMARAVEWLDDVDEPLPDLYDRAVAQCLHVNISGDTRFLDWEATKLWNVVCADIITPLAKICKQWSG